MNIFSLLAEKEDDLKLRGQQVTDDLNKGDYDSLALDLAYYDCYEEEFDYAWERLAMYSTYNRYAVCRNALQALGEEESEHAKEVKAQMESYRSELLEMFSESADSKNKLFVDYYEKMLYNQ